MCVLSERCVIYIIFAFEEKSNFGRPNGRLLSPFLLSESTVIFLRTPFSFLGLLPYLYAPNDDVK